MLVERKSSCNASSDRHSHYTLGMCCDTDKGGPCTWSFYRKQRLVISLDHFSGGMPLRPLQQDVPLWYNIQSSNVRIGRFISLYSTSLFSILNRLILFSSQYFRTAFSNFSGASQPRITELGVTDGTSSPLIVEYKDES